MSAIYHDRDYRHDPDGDALCNVAADGNDMPTLMEIEFPIVVPDQSVAQQFALLVTTKGNRAELWQDDEDTLR